MWDIEIAISKGKSIEKLYQKVPQAIFFGMLDIEIAFSKAKSIENCTKQSKFSPAAPSDQDVRSEEGAKQGGKTWGGPYSAPQARKFCLFGTVFY